MSLNKKTTFQTLKAYLFNREGKYTNPIIIDSEEALTGFFQSPTTREHFWSGLEIRIADDLDFCVFHADKKKILFGLQSPSNQVSIEVTMFGENNGQNRN